MVTEEQLAAQRRATVSDIGYGAPELSVSGMDAERRRVEKIRRDAIRSALGR